MYQPHESKSNDLFRMSNYKEYIPCMLSLGFTRKERECWEVLGVGMSQMPTNSSPITVDFSYDTSVSCSIEPIT